MIPSTKLPEYLNQMAIGENRNSVGSKWVEREREKESSRLME
jgi:hypothetical protein